MAGPVTVYFIARAAGKVLSYAGDEPRAFCEAFVKTNNRYSARAGRGEPYAVLAYDIPEET